MRAPLADRSTLIGLLLAFSVIVSSYAVVSSGLLQRIDLLLYDYFVNWQDNPTSDDIVVIAIDDASLKEFGRWPWSRRLHAEMLDKLTTLGARVVGFDILFAEPEHRDPQADQRFAEAIRRNGKTVLAVAPSNPLPGDPIAEVLPTPVLAASAAGLGHVDIEIDIDGLSRSFYRHAGLGDAHWPTFALAMLDVANPDNKTGQYQLLPDRAAAGLGWLRRDRMLVPFDANPDTLQAISFHQALKSDAIADKVAGKYVLLGSTATGLGDFISTPVSLDHQRMPGVILNAHILNGLLNGRLARQMSHQQHIAITALVAGTVALLIVSTSFPVAIIVFLASVGAILAWSATLLAVGQLWFPPAAAIAPLAVGFLLWGAWSLFHEKRINRSLTVRMQHQALHHSATDLPNQYVLEDHLHTLGSAASNLAETTALIIVHIQWSGSAGGIVGRPAGDRLLSAVGQRLLEVARDDDLVVHFSGDDFGILARRLSSKESALRLANNVVDGLADAIDLDGTRVLLAPRIGLSCWPEDSSDGEALLRDAFIATFRARVQQSTRPCVYSNEIAREVQERSQLEQALRSAMTRGEFEVYYQPQVVTETGRIVGVEALLRWHNPELGLIYPGTFIPVAEHTGLIHAIGGWVLKTACQQVQQWHDQGLGPLRLAVNLSPLQFADSKLVTEVNDALAQSGLNPDALELEITESTLMRNLEEATAAMSLLKQQGIKLAIDDFGTGYSSLSYLQHFPLDRIKIDQTFTRAMHESDNVREITLTIISMAKRLNLDVIAEGVETAAQAAFLDENGCLESQGFYFSHPLPAAEIATLLGHEQPDSGARQKASTLPTDRSKPSLQR